MNDQSGPSTSKVDEAPTTETTSPLPVAPPSGQQHSGQQSGPRVSGDQMRDVDRLRRTGTDRYVAGVAGGLGRHFDIDPTVIRVVLVVLTFFGGAGLLVYAAVWLFVPQDGADQAPIEVGSDIRRILLIVAGVLALSIVFGAPFVGNGWGLGLPLPLIVIGVVVVALFATRDQRRRSPRNQPPPPWGASGATTFPQEGATTTGSGIGAPPGAQPPMWAPPAAPGYVPLPPRPRRTGLLLLWPTLALIAIGLGTLGVIDTTASLPFTAYAALPVAVIGLMLLLGAFVGRPGGLIALGLLASVTLLVTSIVGAATGGSTASSKDLRAVPTSAASVAGDYRVQTGSIELDLTRVSDLSALDGRVVDVGLNAGEVVVTVPAGLNVNVDARVRYLGQINVGAEQRGGFQQSMVRTLTTSTAPTTPTVLLRIHARVGHITVAQQ